MADRSPSAACGSLLSRRTGQRPPAAWYMRKYVTVLPPDAVHWRGICYEDVAVCVPVALMYYTQTTESIIMRPSLDCSPAILVFPYQI